MTLIDEVKELKDWSQEDDFESGDMELDDLDRIVAVLEQFEPGDDAIIDLFIGYISRFKQDGHLIDTSEITTAQGKACLERLHKAAVLMEVKA